MLGIVEALKLYHDQANLVTLFALVMRNEIDEEFAEIQAQIRLTVDDILQSLVEERNVNKSRLRIQAAFQTFKEGRVDKALCYEIIDTMYTAEHPNKPEIVAKLETALELSRKRLLEQSGFRKRKRKLQAKKGSDYISCIWSLYLH